MDTELYITKTLEVDLPVQDGARLLFSIPKFTEEFIASLHQVNDFLYMDRGTVIISSGDKLCIPSGLQLYQKAYDLLLTAHKLDISILEPILPLNGEVFFMIKNNSKETLRLRENQKFIQGVLLPHYHIEMNYVDV